MTPKRYFRVTPINGHTQVGPVGLFRAAFEKSTIDFDQTADWSRALSFLYD
jgi:hypothetical protein